MTSWLLLNRVASDTRDPRFKSSFKDENKEKEDLRGSLLKKYDKVKSR